MASEKTRYIKVNLPDSAESYASGNGEGCWAINFDVLDTIDAAPFAIKIHNADDVLLHYRKAVEAYLKAEEHSLLAVISRLYSLLLLLKKEQERRYVPSGKTQLLQPALDRMNAHYCDRELSVGELATLCGVSVSYFRRVFAEAHGISPKEYIIRRRMDYARQLLLSGQFTVTEVADLCGYAEPCHFSREFSRRTGTSPAQYGKASR